MFFAGLSIFTALGIGAIMVVAVAMIGSVTVLPAVLASLGDRVEKGRIPFLHRLRRDDGEGRVWGWILGKVLKRPGDLRRRRHRPAGRDGAARLRHAHRAERHRRLLAQDARHAGL